MGIKVSEQYPSKYICGDDLQGKRTQVHIVKVEAVEVPDFKDKDKMVNKLELSFAGKDKTMLCGPANAKKLGRELGDDTDDWIDKVIEIWAEEEDVAGTTRNVLKVGTPQEQAKEGELEF